VTRAKPRIPFYWWPFWMVLLALCWLFFYLILTPVWMALRAVAWLSEHGRPSGWTNSSP
jgi:hypothetical protein